MQNYNSAPPRVGKVLGNGAQRGLIQTAMAKPAKKPAPPMQKAKR